ncbi:hypothetical protein [Roseiconus lacunae]|uniref:hypothetical protein n=1 Tax=Roseiconus lacunae TaxID=2605694 RepID=UPI001E5BAC9E|nr:hypothetical protein [Roseiconus lacunae]
MGKTNGPTKVADHIGSSGFLVGGNFGIEPVGTKSWVESLQGHNSPETEYRRRLVVAF